MPWAVTVGAFGTKAFCNQTIRNKKIPQSLASILVHVVFSTKHRAMLIEDDIRDDLHGYVGGIVSRLDGALLRAGSVADHVHLLVSHPRTCSPTELIQEIKTGSSKWLKSKGPSYRDFHWQSGYGMFSISPSHRTAIQAYIDGQKDNHLKTTFQEEFRKLLSMYEMEFDERDVWD